MKVGQSHHWIYKNKKVRDNGRKFVIYQVKKRNKPSPSGSGMPVGSKLHWNIKGYETYRKLKDGSYRVVLKGIKKQYGYSTKKRGRLIRTSPRK